MSAVRSAQRVASGLFALATVLSPACTDDEQRFVEWPSEFSTAFLLERAEGQITSVRGPFASSEAIEVPSSQDRETLLVIVDPEALTAIDPRFDASQPTQLERRLSERAECREAGVLESDGRLTRDGETLASVFDTYRVEESAFVPHASMELEHSIALNYARTPCLGGRDVAVRPAYVPADEAGGLPYGLVPLDDESLLAFFHTKVELRSAGVLRASWRPGTDPISGEVWTLSGLTVDASDWPTDPARVLIVARTSPSIVRTTLFELEIDLVGASGRTLFIDDVSENGAGRLYDAFLEPAGAFVAVGEGVLLTRESQTATIAVERLSNFSGRKVIGSSRSGMRHIIGGGGGLAWLGDASSGVDAMQQESMGSTAGFSSDLVTSALSLARSGAIYLVSAGRVFRRDPVGGPGEGVWPEQFFNLELPTTCSSGDRCGRFEPPKLTRFTTIAIDRASGDDEWFWAQVPDCQELFVHSFVGDCSARAPLEGRSPPQATEFPAKHRAAPMASGVLVGFALDELFHYELVEP